MDYRVILIEIPKGFPIDSRWMPNVFSMNSQWIPYGFPMGPQWIPNAAPPWVIKLFPYKSPVGFQWIPIVFLIDSHIDILWIPSGTMNSQWIPNGSPIDFRLIPSGFPIIPKWIPVDPPMDSQWATPWVIKLFSYRFLWVPYGIQMDSQFLLI